MLCREVKAVQQKLKQLQAESNKRDAKLYANMFSRMTQDISTATKVSILALSNTSAFKV